MKALRKLAPIALVLASCGAGAEEDRRVTSSVSGTAAAEVLGGLSIELRVPPSVRPGDELMTTLSVTNRSGRPVTDPGCHLGRTAYALVPVDDPEAELWMVPTVDCGGPFTYEEGAVEDSDGPTFVAWTKVGDALPPGNYLAVLQVDGQRLTSPVKIISP